MDWKGGLGSGWMVPFGNLLMEAGKFGMTKEEEEPYEISRTMQIVWILVFGVVFVLSFVLCVFNGLILGNMIRKKTGCGSRFVVILGLGIMCGLIALTHFLRFFKEIMYGEKDGLVIEWFMYVFQVLSAMVYYFLLIRMSMMMCRLYYQATYNGSMFHRFKLFCVKFVEVSLTIISILTPVLLFFGIGFWAKDSKAVYFSFIIYYLILAVLIAVIFLIFSVLLWIRLRQLFKATSKLRRYLLILGVVFTSNLMEALFAFIGSFSVLNMESRKKMELINVLLYLLLYILQLSMVLMLMVLGRNMKKTKHHQAGYYESDMSEDSDDGEEVVDYGATVSPTKPFILEGEEQF